MEKKHRGAHSELLATTWLLEQGYDVFRNVSPHGLGDLVAINFDTGEKIVIDVKTSTHPRTTNKPPSRLSPEQVAAGVKAILVFEDGECVWEDEYLVPQSTEMALQRPSLN